MSCSEIVGESSSRVGSSLTRPSKWALSISSQPWVPRRATVSSDSRMLRFLRLFSLSETRSPPLTRKEGMSTFRPLTRKCPWQTSCRAWLREEAKPRR